MLGALVGVLVIFITTLILACIKKRKVESDDEGQSASIHAEKADANSNGPDKVDSLNGNSSDHKRHAFNLHGRWRGRHAGEGPEKNVDGYNDIKKTTQRKENANVNSSPRSKADPRKSHSHGNETSHDNDDHSSDKHGHSSGKHDHSSDKHDHSSDKHGHSSDKHGHSSDKHGHSSDKHGHSSDKHGHSSHKHGHSSDKHDHSHGHHQHYTGPRWVLKSAPPDSKSRQKIIKFLKSVAIRVGENSTMERLLNAFAMGVEDPGIVFETIYKEEFERESITNKLGNLFLKEMRVIERFAESEQLPPGEQSMMEVLQLYTALKGAEEVAITRAVMHAMSLPSEEQENSRD